MTSPAAGKGAPRSPGAPGQGKAPARHRDALPGRHCWVCGRIGGAGFTQALRLAGYDVPDGAIAYAHPDCMQRAQRRAR
jgi:hypothetical protein